MAGIKVAGDEAVTSEMYDKLTKKTPALTKAALSFLMKKRGLSQSTAQKVLRVK